MLCIDPPDDEDEEDAKSGGRRTPNPLAKDSTAAPAEGVENGEQPKEGTEMQPMEIEDEEGHGEERHSEKRTEKPAPPSQPVVSFVLFVWMVFFVVVNFLFQSKQVK